jgi:NADH-quinone oxidoreductase subunit J
LFILLGAEFLALLLLIVYVGAISILFLFVVMMLNLRLVEIYGDLYGYLPVGALIGFLFFFQMLIAVFYEFGTFSSSFVVNAPPIEF